MRPALPLLPFALAGCTPSPVEAPEDSAPFVVPGCGDGVRDADEACDDGAANSDTAPDACRTGCVQAGCGDGVVDAGETCDDGGTWGGDGCSATCGGEAGTAEVEPNDTWDAAGTAEGEGDGALPAGDVDCWSVDVPACGAVEAHEVGDCGVALTLALHDPTGAWVASGAPGVDGCATLDPAEAPGARWVAPGTWSVCVSAVNGAEVRGYALAVSTPDPATLDAPPVGGDLDLDGTPDSCDADRDGDGLDDAEDDCPELSNGPGTPALALSDGGFVRAWLAAGPFTTGVTSGGCRPSEDLFVGEDMPIGATLGDPAGSAVWTARLLSGDVFDLLGPYGGVSAPREAYALVYLRSETARTLTVSVGADDGVFVWWNGARVIDVASCQGVVTDQFQAPVEVAAGWNTLLLKVYDQGGGWGLMARFFDGDGAVVTDLEPSLLPDASWRPDQADGDGDGVGDVCDPSP